MPLSLLHSRILLGIALCIMYAMNYLSSSGYLGGSMTELASIFPFAYMPPGWMFGISWGLIFVSLAVWFVYQCRRNPSTPHQESDYRYEWRLALASIVLNISWLIAISQAWYLLSVVIIILLLIVLAMILSHYRRTGRQEQWYGWITWGIYYGRITIATMVLSTSMVVHTISAMSPDSLALTQSWMWMARGLGLVSTLVSYRWLRNPYALIRSLIAMGTSVWAVFG